MIEKKLVFVLILFNINLEIKMDHDLSYNPCDDGIFRGVTFLSYVNNFEPAHICRIMSKAAPAFFSLPSLGLIKKGTQETFPLPTCPVPHSPIFDWATVESFQKKLYNREIAEWKPGEWESQRPLVSSIVNQIAQLLGFKGCVNVTLNDEEECAKRGEMRFVSALRNTSTILACKPFYHDLMGINGVYSQETAKGVVGHEIGHLDQSLDSLFYPRFEEIKADLYTLRIGSVGRALRDALVNNSKIYPFEFEIARRVNIAPLEVHPYSFERIAYLTEGLCALYPEKNQDICIYSKESLNKANGLFEKLDEQDQGFEAAISAASEAFKSTNYLQSIDLFEKLFEKGQGFEAAISAASENFKSTTDDFARTSAIYLFEKLFEKGQGFEAAISVASEALKSTDDSLTRVYACHLFKKLVEKGLEAAINASPEAFKSKESCRKDD